MPLITLTTDYGTQDHYTGALKGLLYNANKDIIIVDINHEIPSYDLIPAAFIMKNATNKFPQGTIHIAIINIRDGNSRYLIVKRKENFYVVPDNGLICMLFPDEDFMVYAYQGLNKDFSFSELHHALANMIAAIANNTIEDVCVRVTSYKVLNLVEAFVSGDVLRGSVLYIDKYHNIITNITKETFYNYVQEKLFIISIRHNKILKISKHYADVEEGEALAMFNDDGYLEIAMNKSNASGLLGLAYGQIVLVEHQLI